MIGRLKKYHRLIDVATVTISAVLILLLMMAAAVDSIGRSVFRQPIEGVYEFSKIAVAGIGFLAIAYTQLRKSHISMNLIKGRLPSRAGAFYDLFILALSIITVLLLGWVGLQDALENIRFGDQLTSGSLTIPIGPPKLIIPFGCFLLALRFISQSVDDITRLLGNKADKSADSPDDRIDGEAVI